MARHRGSPIPPATKSAALRELGLGVSPTQVAKRLGISRAIAYRWRARMNQNRAEIPAPPPPAEVGPVPPPPSAGPLPPAPASESSASSEPAPEDLFRAASEAMGTSPSSPPPPPGAGAADSSPSPAPSAGPEELDASPAEMKKACREAWSAARWSVARVLLRMRGADVADDDLEIKRLAQPSRFAILALEQNSPTLYPILMRAIRGWLPLSLILLGDLAECVASAEAHVKSVRSVLREEEPNDGGNGAVPAAPVSRGPSVDESGSGAVHIDAPRT